MRRRLALLALALAVAAAPGCSHRERSNIFDPGNPVTRGQPLDFTALAGNGVIQLSWRPVSAEGLIGYEVLRRIEGESDFTPLGGILSPLESRLSDFAVVDGADHVYRIYYVFSGGRAGLPAEDVAAPGPLRVWLADLEGRLLRLTPDGRRVATSDDGFGSPSYVAANPVSGVLWVSDSPRGEVVLFSPSIGPLFTFTGLTRPGAIGLDVARRTAWVCDDAQGAVHHLGETGTWVSPQLGPFDDPLACAVDPVDGSVWVCENRGNRVRRFSPDGALLADRPLARPSRIAVDSLTREAWVTSLDQARAFRLGPDGVPLDTVALSGPVGVAVDARRGRVWIADAGGGAVVALARDGTQVFRIGGLARVTEIAVDPRTGDAWATRPDAGEAVRIAADGSKVRRLGSLGQPYGISLANAPG